MSNIPWTWLKIDGVNPLSRHARKVAMSYKPIDGGGDNVRLANGNRVSLRISAFNKYSVTISGEGFRKPAINHLNRGSVVVIECPLLFDQPGEISDANLKRTAVTGTKQYWGVVEGVPQILPAGDPGILWTQYRPIMTIMIDGIDISYTDAEANGTWSISGEEV